MWELKSVSEILAVWELKAVSELLAISMLYGSGVEWASNILRVDSNKWVIKIYELIALNELLPVW